MPGHPDTPQGPWGAPGHCPGSLPPSLPQCLRRLLGTSPEPRALSAPLYLQDPEMCVFPRSSCTPSAHDFAPRRLDSQDGFFWGRGVAGGNTGCLSPPLSPPSGSLSLWLPLVGDLEAEMPEREALLPSLRCLHAPTHGAA